MNHSAPSSHPILWVSNGHGEDQIAQALIMHWQQTRPQDNHQALAMVGEGSAYTAIQVPLLTPGFVPPSAGFAYLHPALLWKDLQAGLARHLSTQWKALHAVRQTPFALRIAVGDIVPLLALYSSGHYHRNRQRDNPYNTVKASPNAFVACALSDYYTAGKSSFDPLQVALLRREQIQTYTRDSLTADNLRQRGVCAISLGNPMQLPIQDKFLSSERLANPRPGSFHGLLLPGSHSDCEANVHHLLQQIKTLPLALKNTATPVPHWHLLLSQHLDFNTRQRIAQQVTEQGQPHAVGFTFHEGTTEGFAHLLPRIHFAIGLAGTANEQCVAHGVPVISFSAAATAQQYTAAFGEAQQRLLGAGLRFYPQITPELLAWQIRHLYAHYAEYRRVTQQVADQRFGTGRAVQRMVGHLQNLLTR